MISNKHETGYLSLPTVGSDYLALAKVIHIPYLHGRECV